MLTGSRGKDVMRIPAVAKLRQPLLLLKEQGLVQRSRGARTLGGASMITGLRDKLCCARALKGALSLEKPALLLVRDREHSDDDPRVGGDEVELLGGPEEEVEVGLQKRVEVLLSNLRESRRLVTLGRT